jgi:hypothetical protein
MILAYLFLMADTVRLAAVVLVSIPLPSKFLPLLITTCTPYGALETRWLVLPSPAFPFRLLASLLLPY